MLTLRSDAVSRVLEGLFAAAERTDPPLLEHAWADANRGGGMVVDSAMAATLGVAFMPVSPDAGRFLYILARSLGCRSVVEFGTSFGISTLFLASAVRDNGGGRVIATEQEPEKVRRARQSLDEAGLGDLVEIREGDARETLRDLDAPIDLLFLDGWKDLYLPILKLVEPRLRAGAAVVADDLDIFPDATRGYLEYVRDPANGYESVEVPLGDRFEFSARAR